MGLVCVLLGWLPGLAWSQSSGPALVADRLADGATEPVIDGRVVEDVWRSAVAYTDFTQQDPSEGAPATERTEVRVLVGRDNLFISVICFDTDPSRIIASQSRRDATLTDVDSIIVALDTFNDSQNAFIFGTNLAQVGIALASSLSGWINALLLAAVLLSRTHWLPDPRLTSRTWRMALATIGMSAAVVGLLLLLKPALARPDLKGVVALLGICALGALVYGGLGALLGVVKMSEIRFLLRRQPGVRPADPTEQP